jgi:outer membrane usher protein
VSLTVGFFPRQLQLRQWTVAVASTATCLFAVLPLHSLAADNQSGIEVTPPETLVLRINLNTENKGDLFVQRTSDLDFLVKVEDLKTIGFRDPTGTVHVIDGEPHLSLKSMRGIVYTFDEKALELNISAEPDLLPMNALALRAHRRRGPLLESSDSAFLNYALTASGGTHRSSSGLGLAGEMGVRLGDYLFLSDAGTVSTTTGKKFVRLISSVTRDDRENLRRIVIGDLLTPTRDFSSALNIGGLGISKAYGIDPYFVRFPTQTLSGNVALPSDMEVYLDGQRIRTEKLRPGEFELRDILGYGGAQDIQIVLRDAFGRVQQLSYSLYFTDQPLQQGLHEYSYNFGAIRRQYGIESNRYGPAAFSMFHRFGLNNAMTVGWRAEVTRHLANTGPTATLVLGAFGVLNLGVARSAIAGRQGTAAILSYSFQSKNWNVGMFLRRDGRNYASLGDPPVMTNRKLEGSVSASYRLPKYGTLSLSHAALFTRSGEAAARATPELPFNRFLLDDRRITTASYTAPLGSTRLNLTASLSHVRSGTGPSRNEAYLGLSILLDRDHSATMSLRRDQQSHSESVRFSRNQPVGEGLGYTVSVDRFNAEAPSTQFRSEVQYNAPAAVLRGDVGHFLEQGQRGEEYRASLAGGVVFVGGHVAISRPVTQSYAIVKVGDVPGVGIMVDDQPVATTNSKGLAVIPTLSAYYENSVSVSPTSLPMEYAMPAAVRRISPLLRSGAFIDFGVTKTQAFSGKLISRSGQPKAVEFQELQLSVDGQVRKLPTGRGGEFYVENLTPGKYVGTVAVDGKPCDFELTVDKSDDLYVDLGEIGCLQRP